MNEMRALLQWRALRAAVADAPPWPAFPLR